MDRDDWGDQKFASRKDLSEKIAACGLQRAAGLRITFLVMFEMPSFQESTQSQPRMLSGLQFGDMTRRAKNKSIDKVKFARMVAERPEDFSKLDLESTMDELIKRIRSANGIRSSG